jgi:glutamine amidotransferase-like uncharacterized protein
MARIAVFRHHPVCSRQCAAAVAHVLAVEHDVIEIGLTDLTAEGLSHFDLLVMPGGDGDAARFHSLFATRRHVVQDFVAKGGAYLGICMGAYWGGQNYFSLLPETYCLQYISRPRAEIHRSYKTALRIEWEGASDSMYFYDGCTFVGPEHAFRIIARYSNGDPMAIINRKVGLIGCHPESQRDWYDTQGLLPHWHHGRHHDLLRGFVRSLERQATLLHRLHSQSALEPQLVDEIVAEITHLRNTLQSIKEMTDLFSQGTLRQVNHLARASLKSSPHDHISEAGDDHRSS